MHASFGDPPRLSPCPGLYCGRINESSECGPCPRGFRPSGSRESASLCLPCEATPSLYDCMYLGFMLLLIFLCHCSAIERCFCSVPESPVPPNNERRPRSRGRPASRAISFPPVPSSACRERRNSEGRIDENGIEVDQAVASGPSAQDVENEQTRVLISIFLCVVTEIIVASLLTLLLTPPVGSLGFKVCSVRLLSDWYTLFHNPNVNYERTLHCTHEAVYPLYSMVFLFYVLTFVLMILLRPWLIRYFKQREKDCKHLLTREYDKQVQISKTSSRSVMTVYAALYFIPGLVLIHAVLGGLIYFAFPYLSIAMGLVANAVHFATRRDQSPNSLFWDSVQEPKNIRTLLTHAAFLAYGIIASTQLRQLALHGSLLVLVPVPALFYIASARFTDPRMINDHL